MPLKSGNSKKTIGENIAELMKSKTARGKKRTRKQNIAIALSKAREGK